MKQALEHIVIAELDTLGFDLVEFRVGGSRGRPVLDIRMDRRDSRKVTVGDCEQEHGGRKGEQDADYPGKLAVVRVPFDVHEPFQDIDGRNGRD